MPSVRRLKTEAVRHAPAGCPRTRIPPVSYKEWVQMLRLSETHPAATVSPVL